MNRWFIPNPASVAPAVLAAQVTPPGVGTLLRRKSVAERMQEFFFPRFELPVFQVCLREGLLQMAVEWFADKQILMIVNGPMSQEWYDIADDCGAKVTIFDSAYGTETDLRSLEACLKREPFDVLMLVETDVYMGSRLDLEKIGLLCRSLAPDAFLVADISGSVFCEAEAGAVQYADICLCGSEMAMGLPPGLGMAVLNERAHARLLAHNLKNGNYFNYARRAVSSAPSALDAPAYPLLNALNKQIDLVLAEGMPERQQRMREVRNMIHNWAAVRNFTPLSVPSVQALNCTALQLPIEFTAASLSEYSAELGISLLPGTQLMPRNSLVLYHGNETGMNDAEVLLKVMDRFLRDYDIRRRHAVNH